MSRKKADAIGQEQMKRSLKGRILKNTILNIFVLVIVCCVIMAAAMQSLSNNILLDSLQPMARQSAKTVEANIHMLADRMMSIAADPQLGTAACRWGGRDGECRFPPGKPRYGANRSCRDL